jgi:hypothetical protein
VTIKVNVDNFTRAETDRMFQAVLADSGGTNRPMFNRTPTPLDHQPIIRQNRDTLYSGFVVDINEGATLVIPDHGHRYLAAMPINQDGHVNAVFYGPGEYGRVRAVGGTVRYRVRDAARPDPGRSQRS